MSTYDTLRHFADTWGLVFLFTVFICVIFWVFRPGSRKVYDEAADIPLRNEEPGDRGLKVEGRNNG